MRISQAESSEKRFGKAAGGLSLAMGGSGAEALNVWRGRPRPHRPPAKQDPALYNENGQDASLPDRQFLLAAGVRGRGRPRHIQTQKEKANLISQTGLYLMPATTYAP